MVCFASLSALRTLFGSIFLDRVSITKLGETAVCFGDNKSLAILFPFSGRHEKFEQLLSSGIPKEFFYGSEALVRSGASVHYFDSRLPPKSRALRCLLKFEYYVRRLQRFPISLCRVAGIREQVQGYGKILSLTDYLSLGLGLSNSRNPFNSKIIGGFHGLSDIYHSQSPSNKSRTKDAILRALEGLDKIFFLGESDEEESKSLFDICDAKVFRFRFGVDTEFWSPSDGPCSDYILSVGSDKNRDYGTLIDACETETLKIITKLKLQKYRPSKNVDVISGSLHEPSFNDLELRDLYRKASIVAVPVSDVFQPSGQSVTLQAMSCGKPVILSQTRGLWDKNSFVSGKNCILVPPNDPLAIRNAISLLSESQSLREKIGRNARSTATRYFSMSRMDEDFCAMINGV